MSWVKLLNDGQELLDILYLRRLVDRLLSGRAGGTLISSAELLKVHLNSTSAGLASTLIFKIWLGSRKKVIFLVARPTKRGGGERPCQYFFSFFFILFPIVNKRYLF